MFPIRYFAPRYFPSRYFTNGTLSIGPECAFGILSLMRDTPVSASGALSDAAIVASSTITDFLAVTSLMRDTAVMASGAMSDDPVTAQADLC